MPSEFVDGRETIVALGTYNGKYKATGKSFRADFARVWTILEGKAVRFVQYADALFVGRAMQP